MNSLPNALKTQKNTKTKTLKFMRYREGLLGYLFMLPTIIGFSVFVVYPLITSIYYSMTDWTGLGDSKFIGFRNFHYMVNVDPSFWKSIKVTLLFVLMTVPTGLVLGIILAVLLNKKLPGMKIFRTLYYVPVVLPSVAALVLWKFIFNPQYGLANNLLKVFNLPTSKWLEDPKTALMSMAIVMLWGVGSTVIIILSGLQSVPAEIYEAAVVDGASGMKQFRNITLPMITPVLFLQLITSVIAAFQTFNLPQLLTNYSGRGGGPNFATDLLAYSIYDNAFGNSKFGYAMAQVLVLFFIILVLTIIIFKFSNSFVYYEADDSR